MRVSRQSSSSVSCWSKNSPALNCSMPRISSGGAGSSQRARTGSRVSPPGTRLGGRADLRSRLLGPGVLRSDDPPEAQLVLEELAHERIVERFRQSFRSIRKGDPDALMKVVGRGEVSLGQLVHARVLEVPNGARLPDELAVESDDALGVADDLRELADLASRLPADVLVETRERGQTSTLEQIVEAITPGRVRG